MHHAHSPCIVKLSALVVLGFACTVLGSACETSLAPIEVADGCPEHAVRGPVQFSAAPGPELIDDFESGDGKLIQTAARNGSWILGAKDGNFASTRGEVSPGCAARGKRAGHFFGSVTPGWTNWTASFRADVGSVAQPYDARAYGGISFWAAAGRHAEPPLEAPVGLTTLDLAWNGNRCVSPDKCNDYYGKIVPLTYSWQRVEVRFDDLFQSGWGKQVGPLRRDELVGFIIWPTRDFDIWIDDLKFEP